MQRGVLHLGYGWLSLGFLLLALSGFTPTTSQSAALHALTVGAIGTMTLAVMTRASLGHSGRPLSAGPGTSTIYALVTLSAVLRLAASIRGSQYVLFLSLAAAMWSGAFGLSRSFMRVRSWHRASGIIMSARFDLGRARRLSRYYLCGLPSERPAAIDL